MNLDLDRYVPGMLLWVSNKISNSASRLYKTKFGIGVAEWRVLSYMALYPWSTASQACEFMGLDKAAVSRSLAFLQDLDWLKSRPDGLRKIEYATTATGKRFYSRIVEMALAREDALLTGFSPTEKNVLIQFLHRLLDNLDAVSQVGWDDS